MIRGKIKVAINKKTEKSNFKDIKNIQTYYCYDVPHIVNRLIRGSRCDFSLNFKGTLSVLKLNYYLSLTEVEPNYSSHNEAEGHRHQIIKSNFSACNSEPTSAELFRGSDEATESGIIPVEQQPSQSLLCSASSLIVHILILLLLLHCCHHLVTT